MNPDLLKGLLNNKKGVMGLLASLAMIGSGIFVWKTSDNSGTKVEVIDSGQGEGISETKEVVVDVSGAVKTPGLYRLTSGTRMGEAIEKAGGLSEKADQDWVDRYVNLSEVLKDGMKVYIPKKEQIQNANSQITNQIQNSSDKISLNKASQTELENLPGVGPVIAGKIISARPFTRVEELSEKKLVNSKVYQQIKDMVVVW